MLQMINCNWKIINFIILFGLLIIGCDTGVEPSPEPGLLRITLASDPADSMIVIAKDTLFTSKGDSFNVSIFQGKAYQDSLWTILFNDTLEYSPEEHRFNLLEHGRADTAFRYTIFESYVPPGEYSAFEFGITAAKIFLTYGYAVGGRTYPMQTPAEDDKFVKFNEEYVVDPGMVTEINLFIKPFDSVERYRDLFWFQPSITVESVKNNFYSY